MRSVFLGNSELVGSELAMGTHRLDENLGSVGWELAKKRSISLTP
jgi:hypothetical protein